MVETLNKAGKDALDAGQDALNAANIIGIADIDNLKNDAKKEVTLTLSPEDQTLFVKSNDFINKLKEAAKEATNAETDANKKASDVDNATNVLRDISLSGINLINKAETEATAAINAATDATTTANNLIISTNKFDFITSSNNMINKHSYSDILLKTNKNDFIYQIKKENNNIIAEINNIVKKFLDVNANINVTNDDKTQKNTLHFNKDNIDDAIKIIDEISTTAKTIKYSYYSDYNPVFDTTQENINKIKDTLQHYHDANNLQSTKQKTIDHIVGITNSISTDVDKNIENVEKCQEQKVTLDKVITEINNNISTIQNFFTTNKDTINDIDKKTKNINNVATINSLFADAYNNASEIQKKVVDANKKNKYVTSEIQKNMLDAANVEINKINIVNDKDIISLPNIFKFINENENTIVNPPIAFTFDTFYKEFVNILKINPDTSIIDDIEKIYNNADYNITNLISNNDNAIKFAEFTGIILAIKCINSGNHFLSEAVKIQDEEETMTKSKNLINDIKKFLNDAIDFYNSISRIDANNLINFSKKFIQFINDNINKLNTVRENLKKIITQLIDINVNVNNINKPNEITDNIFDANNNLKYDKYMDDNKFNNFDDLKQKYLVFLTDFRDIGELNIEVDTIMRICDHFSNKEITQIINNFSSSAVSTIQSLFDKNHGYNNIDTHDVEIENPLLLNRNNGIELKDSNKNNEEEEEELDTVELHSHSNNVIGAAKIKDVKTCIEQVKTNIIDPIHEYIEKLKTVINDLDRKYNALANCVFCNNIYYAAIAFMNYYYANNIAEVIVNATSNVVTGPTIDVNSINDAINTMITNYESNKDNIKKTTRSNIDDKVEQVSEKIHNFSEKINAFTESMNDYSTTIDTLNTTINDIVSKENELDTSLENVKTTANSFKELATEFNIYVNTSFAIKGGAKTRFANKYKYKCKNQKVGSIQKIKKLRVRNANTMKIKYLKRRTL